MSSLGWILAYVCFGLVWFRLGLFLCFLSHSGEQEKGAKLQKDARLQRVLHNRPELFFCGPLAK